jgi:hypothetical protein
MKKTFLGNNCGLTYKDDNNNILLLSVTPHIFQEGDPVKVYLDDQWHTGRIEYDEGEFGGYYFYNETDENNHSKLETGMKIKYLTRCQND